MSPSSRIVLDLRPAPLPGGGGAAKPANLVISDFNMPKMDGLALLRAVRSHPPIRQTAFVMLTGRADRELVQRAVQFGVNNYCVKPFTVQGLRDKIEQVFGQLT